MHYLLEHADDLIIDKSRSWVPCNYCSFVIHSPLTVHEICKPKLSNLYVCGLIARPTFISYHALGNESNVGQISLLSMLFKSWKQQIMQITNLPHMWGIILLYIFGYFNKMNLKCSCYEIKGQPTEFATLSSFKIWESNTRFMDSSEPKSTCDSNKLWIMNKSLTYAQYMCVPPSKVCVRKAIRSGTTTWNVHDRCTHLNAQASRKLFHSFSPHLTTICRILLYSTIIIHI